MSDVDIVLIYPPWDVKCYQPIGLPILANHFKNVGFTSIIIDAIALEFNNEQIVDEVRKVNPEVIGVSVPFTAMVKNARELIRILKKEFPDKEIFCGGYHVIIKPEDFSDLDITIAPYEVGIDYKYPEWELMLIEKYDLSLYLVNDERAFPIQSSIGCPFSCTFCCNSKRREKVQNRPINDVIDEIKYVMDKFKVYAFHFWDETFTLNKKRVTEICKKIVNEKLPILWTAQTRANKINDEILQVMSDAGCVRLSIGVESGNEKVLKTINKKIKLSDVENAIRMINNAGMVSYAGFMIGHVEDNIDSIIDTIRFADKCDPTFVGFRIAIPYPGCKFRDDAEKKGKILTNDFSKYTDDNVVYIPEGIKGYDIKKIQRLAYAWFYVNKLKRIISIFNRNFNDIIDYIDEFEPDVFNMDIKDLIEKYCKVK